MAVKHTLCSAASGTNVALNSLHHPSLASRSAFPHEECGVSALKFGSCSVILLRLLKVLYEAYSLLYINL